MARLVLEGSFTSACNRPTAPGRPPGRQAGPIRLHLQIQTCENRGCFASTPVAPELLAALKSGKQLKVSFQTLAKETISIPMPLADFAAAYDKIK